MSRPRTTVSLRRITDDGRSVHIQVDLLDYVTRILTPQLEDPQRPRCCPLCFSVCSITLKDDDCDQLLSHLLVHKHDFFTACITALAAPRSESDRTTLRALLGDNRVRCSDPHWHSFAQRQAVGDPLEVFLTALIACVTSGIPGNNLKSKGWFKAQARMGSWPMSPDQLLPYGALASVASYVCWCHTLLSPFTVPLLALFLEVARSEFLPALLAPPQKDILMQALVVMLHGPPGAQRANYVGPRVSMWKLPADCPDILIPQQAAAELLKSIMRGPGAKPDDFDKLYAGHEGPLYLALMSAVDSRAIQDDMLHFTMCLLTQELHKKLSLPPSPAQSAVDDSLLQFKRRLKVPEGMPYDATLVFMILHRQSTSKACSAAGCREAGKQACARCKIVRYCGRACQRNDWRVPQGDAFDVSVTHKTVCPIICKLSDAGLSVDGQSIPQSLPRFANLYPQVGIPFADYRELVSWGVVAGLLPSSVLADIGESDLHSFST